MPNPTVRANAITLSTLFRRAHASARSGARPRMSYRDAFRSALRRAWRDERMRRFELTIAAKAIQPSKPLNGPIFRLVEVPETAKRFTADSIDAHRNNVLSPFLMADPIALASRNGKSPPRPG